MDTGTIVLIAVSVVIAFAIGYVLRKYIAEAKIASAEYAARKIIEEGEQKAQGAKREALLEAKEEIHRQRIEMEREAREVRSELQKIEKRL
ncbi:MAG TPA: DUF3552 domain-containing protein, partial [Firmicutes bacterium]|nr:DUF3552 domain-containing protein [Bacillota bacterium]